MIKNNVNIDFGHGDIAMIGGSKNGVGKVGFKQTKKTYPIGIIKEEDYISNDFESKDFECPIVMTFNNVESIDTVIKVLENIKLGMQKG